MMYGPMDCPKSTIGDHYTLHVGACIVCDYIGDIDAYKTIDHAFWINEHKSNNIMVDVVWDEQNQWYIGIEQ